MRKIIHVDCDCFYASVETRDDPSLHRRPVAVGGDPGRRGVIATCNYEARSWGIRSAMASAHAMRLCPELVLVPPNFDKYRKVSREIHQIFQQYTQQIEPLSLDEAYLDVTDCEQLDNSATRIAQAIRKQVKQQVGITVSAGVAPNKFLAKVASDWEKPDGLFVITPEQVAQFVLTLPVHRINGVGRVTGEKMKRLGITTCADLQSFSRIELAQNFGSFGERLYSLCRGVDDKPVRPSRRRKSISVENTYQDDLPSLNACLNKLPDLLERLESRYQKLDNGYRISAMFGKMRYADFSIATAEQSGDHIDGKLLETLLESLWLRKEQPVRLLGIGVKLQDMQAPFQQADFFPREYDQALREQSLGYHTEHAKKQTKK